MSERVNESTSPATDLPGRGGGKGEYQEYVKHYVSAGYFPMK